MAYYFVSDVHAGLLLNGKPTDSEARFLAWLDRVGPDAEAIFLVGDIFDFWYETPRKVPTGYDRLLDAFSALTARGIALHFFPGNHDMWTGNHLASSGLIIHNQGLYTTLCGRRVYIEHGDQQSIRSGGERFIQSIFRSPIARRLAQLFVPHRAMMRFGNSWSRANRAKFREQFPFGNEEEGLVRFAREYMHEHPVDLFVFGHLHNPTIYPLSATTTLYVLSDWITDPHPAYGRLDEHGFSLERY
ncbi:MAG: UDP-2,3-diacylglucosamine diphosphatase [Rikenellaceae bacterium]|jgi:UDP-2,3-diacylglucosamine hydrolase|nr:UDP-2,3-diacylglucosamine diphosphatase [Rikenellaceae bacterium]